MIISFCNWQRKLFIQVRQRRISQSYACKHRLLQKTCAYLDSNNIIFHTYQLKEEKPYRIVIKNIHYSAPIDDIKIDCQTGRNIVNAKSKVPKMSISLLLYLKLIVYVVWQSKSSFFENLRICSVLQKSLWYSTKMCTRILFEKLHNQLHRLSN